MMMIIIIMSIIVMISTFMIEKLIKLTDIKFVRVFNCYNLYYRKVEVFWSSGYFNGRSSSPTAVLMSFRKSLI